MECIYKKFSFETCEFFCELDENDCKNCPYRYSEEDVMWDLADREYEKNRDLFDL